MKKQTPSRLGWVIGAGVVILAVISCLLIGSRALSARSAIPDALSVESIQQDYGAQLERLRAVVKEFDSTGYGQEGELQQDRELFAAREIIKASVQTGEQSYLGIATKERGFVSRSTFFSVTPRVGRPSVNAWRLKGQEYSVVVYEELVPLEGGEVRSISMTFDIAKTLSRDSSRKPENPASE